MTLLFHFYYSVMAIIQEFKEFAIKGNVIDLAVGVIIGAGFNKIVSSLVDDVIMPPLGLLLGGVPIKDLNVVLKNASSTEPALILKYGQFFQTLIDFTILAVVIFMMVKFINNLRATKPEAGV